MAKTIQEITENKFTKTDSCWLWNGYVDKDGYGTFAMYIDTRHSTSMRAHRALYQIYKGNIPNGLQLDHLCRNRKCVNPEHLEAVTQSENLKRSPLYNSNKTSCKRGHEFTPENTSYRKDRNGRICKKCRYILLKKWRDKNAFSTRQTRKS